ncbi:hypothetical protein H4582DRAFT_2071765 [Lactarius indigo]|nr:hypothetical protein H4582DRAFT_2071765 [Lactarius indigo]
MAFDACEKFVGPMPVELFLSEFNENEFASIATLVDAPSRAYLSFLQIRLIEDAGLCPNLRFINTTSCIAAKLKPDIAIYSGTDRNGPWTYPSSPPPPEWRAVDLWIENENKGNDVFHDLEQMETANQDVKSHIRWTKGACQVSGQLIAYTSAIHRSPFRAFSFSVVLFGNTGRLLRWDRSGVIYTAIVQVEDLPGLENVAKDDLHKFLVRDDRTPNGQIKHYIAPSAVWDSEALFGRSTFGYIAYDPETRNLVYLKDFWRTDRDGIEKEGDVYRELHDAQRTMTQEFVKGNNWCPGQPRVDPYVHYRLVLETLGESVYTFKSTRQLCKVIRDAIVAHTEAYERVGILHRDVSAGNILISKEGSGILIDWDLSKKVVKDGSGKPRQHSRTGTWQFISIARLRAPLTRPHEVSDDLESFFWVLLYLVAKCRSPGKINLSKEVQIVFDQSEDMDDDGIIRGGRGKLHCLGQAELGPAIVESLIETPCKDIIEELRSLFNNLYRYVNPPLDTVPSMKLRIKSKRDRDAQVQDALKKLRSSKEVLAIIDRYLGSGWDKSWDAKNDGSLYKVKFRPDPATSRNRRKCEAEDDGGKDFNERRRGRFPPSSTQASGSRDMVGLQRHRSSSGSGSSRTRLSENE